eukprot:3288022-Amphidinium_carterae.1
MLRVGIRFASGVASVSRPRRRSVFVKAKRKQLLGHAPARIHTRTCMCTHAWTTGLGGVFLDVKTEVAGVSSICCVAGGILLKRTYPPDGAKWWAGDPHLHVVVIGIGTLQQSTA